MNDYTIANSTLFPEFQIKLIILWLDKTNLTMITTLNKTIGMA